MGSIPYLCADLPPEAIRWERKPRRAAIPSPNTEREREGESIKKEPALASWPLLVIEMTGLDASRNSLLPIVQRSTQPVVRIVVEVIPCVISHNGLPHRITIQSIHSSISLHLRHLAQVIRGERKLGRVEYLFLCHNGSQHETRPDHCKLNLRLNAGRMIHPPLPLSAKRE